MPTHRGFQEPGLPVCSAEAVVSPPGDCSLCIHGREALPIPRAVVIQPAGCYHHSHLAESPGGCLGI